MADVILEQVTKRYAGGVDAIRGIDLSIEHGELIVMVGPSGCGKSTLLRMVAGLERISSGEVRINGKRVNNLEPAERDIAMVFQNYALYPHMSVYDNMAYGLKNRRTPKADIRRRVEEAARILELDTLLTRKPRQLSGGQRQRVAMGRAIVREPQAFLFDEPLSNLDAKLRVQMRLEIKRLQRRLGVTSLYVTHDQVEAMTLADRLVVMNGGRAEQVGAPIEVYQYPATVFVAGFIGSPAMNFLDARLGSDQRSVILTDGDVLTLPAELPLAADTPVTLGIRPEHLNLSDDRPGVLHLEAELIETLGADTVVHGRLPGENGLLTVRLDGIRPVTAGERIALAADPAMLHVFSKDSGQRIDSRS